MHSIDTVIFINNYHHNPIEFQNGDVWSGNAGMLEMLPRKAGWFTHITEVSTSKLQLAIKETIDENISTFVHNYIFLDFKEIFYKINKCVPSKIFH